MTLNQIWSEYKAEMAQLWADYCAEMRAIWESRHD
jgi:hypothetical protein